MMVPSFMGLPSRLSEVFERLGNALRDFSSRRRAPAVPYGSCKNPIELGPG